jgi:uncharacterized protein YutE (UPF0331/DUF86 family)
MLPERLRQLETNIAELSAFRQSHTIGDIRQDTIKQWALRYGLLESIQIVIDIACHMVVHQNLGNTRTYAECFELLQKAGYIEAGTEATFKSMAGLRNLLVHEYIKIDLEQLYGMLDQLDDFKTFAQIIRKMNP